MSDPFVSVVVATRNRERLLPRALASVLVQDGPSLELIVVDDASGDATPKLLSAWAASDRRITVLRQNRPSGAAVARNVGAAEARGRFLAFLDDDDEWMPGKLRSQVAEALEREAGVVSCVFVEVAPDGTEIVGGEVDLRAVPARSMLVRGNLLGLSAVVVAREQFERVGGFDERLPRLQDWDLWIRLSGISRFSHVAEPLARIHRTRQSISTDPSALVEAAEILAAKHGAPGALERDEHADLLLSLARLLLRNGQTREGRRLALRSLRRDPWAMQRLLKGSLMAAAPRTYAAATSCWRYLWQCWRCAGQGKP